MPRPKGFTKKHGLAVKKAKREGRDPPPLGTFPAELRQRVLRPDKGITTADFCEAKLVQFHGGLWVCHACSLANPGDPKPLCRTAAVHRRSGVYSGVSAKDCPGIVAHHEKRDGHADFAGGSLHESFAKWKAKELEYDSLCIE
jgi:hypothetical protein